MPAKYATTRSCQRLEAYESEVVEQPRPYEHEMLNRYYDEERYGDTDEETRESAKLIALERARWDMGEKAVDQLEAYPQEHQLNLLAADYTRERGVVRVHFIVGLACTFGPSNPYC